jgi:hypothetical protein
MVVGFVEFYQWFPVKPSPSLDERRLPQGLTVLRPSCSIARQMMAQRPFPEANSSQTKFGTILELPGSCTHQAQKLQESSPHEQNHCSD